MNPRWLRIASGEIPWSLEGLLAALTFHERLMKTPCDDWDLAPGKGEAIALDPTKFETQLFRFLSRRYDDEVVLGSHWFRYIEIRAFVNRYRHHLTRLGLIRRHGTAMIGISDSLFQALAELPYSRKLKDGDRTFDLPAVVWRAVEIAKSQSSHR